MVTADAYAELLAGTGTAPTRALLADRGLARLALGDPAAASRELEAALAERGTDAASRRVLGAAARAGEER